MIHTKSSLIDIISSEIEVLLNDQKYADDPHIHEGIQYQIDAFTNILVSVKTEKPLNYLEYMWLCSALPNTGSGTYE